MAVVTKSTPKRRLKPRTARIFLMESLPAVETAFVGRSKDHYISGVGKAQLNLILAAFFTVFQARAVEIAGIRFDDSVQVGKEKLLLNGAGLRTATILKAKVYGAALYLRQKASSEAEALAAPYPKQLQMEFLREMEGSDIGKAWDASFADNCESNCDRHKGNIAKLKGLMVSVKAGDRMIYTFQERTVELTFNGKKQGELTGEGFPSALLATWIGKHPPTETLKAGLLGKQDP